MTIREDLMLRCLQLAARGEGHVMPNPMVGCVIEQNGNVLAEGFHRQYGGPHAEVEALRRLPSGQIPPDATVYVSLEPCAHHGKTPPCADALVAAGAKRVIVACRDPFEQVNGRGIDRLREAGVEVIEGVAEHQARWLNRRFFTFHGQKRPFILLKWAETADGFMDAERAPGQTGVRWISAPETKKLVHLRRSREAAILIGAQTALIDNPSLTVREVEGKNPVRILLDPDLRVPHDSKLFDPAARTLVIHCLPEADSENRRFVPRDRVLPALMEILYQEGLQSIMVEGGRATLQSFIDAGLWDEMMVIRSSAVTFGSGLPSPVIGLAAANRETLGTDTIHYYHR